LYELIITFALSEKNCSNCSFFSCPNLSTVIVGFCICGAPGPLMRAYCRAFDTVFAATCKIYNYAFI